MDYPRHIKSGPIPVLRDWRKLPTKQLTRGERNCRFIERVCVIPEGDHVGKPVSLAQFQEEFFISIYDNPEITDTAALSIARKNAKTGTIAFLALLHIVGPEAKENSRIESGAMSRKQAAEVFNYASKCIMLAPKLRDICKIVPSNKTIIGLPMNVTYQALSADADTAHGGSPVVAIIDEVGRVKGPKSDFVDAISTSQGAYSNPLMIYISTQSPTDADLFSTIIDDCIRNKPPKTVCHVYAADQDADVLDEQAWKDANPALGIFRSIEDVRKNAHKASRMPSFENTFRNLYLNQRVSVVSPFVSRDVFQRNGEKPSGLQGMTIYGGLDLSSIKDLTAFILMGRDDQGIAHVHTYAWTPKETVADRSKEDRVPYDVWVKNGFLRTTPGHTVDYDFVAKEIAEIIEDLDVASIAFDRWNIQSFIRSCDHVNVKLPLVPYGQGYKDMSPALNALETDLLNNKMRHGMHPVLTMCAGNAVVVMDPAGGRKLDKSKATGRIDCMVALAMAEGAARLEEGEKPAEYKMFFV